MECKRSIGNEGRFYSFVNINMWKTGSLVLPRTAYSFKFQINQSDHYYFQEETED